MSWFKRVVDDYFDDKSSDANDNGSDPDIYDDSNEVSNPASPLWDGSDVHSNPYGTDPSMPDPNEVNSD
jgi:hypothetical protein